MHLMHLLNQFHILKNRIGGKCMKNIISSIYCRFITVLNLNICKCRFCEFYNDCDISEKNLNIEMHTKQRKKSL